MTFEAARLLEQERQLHREVKKHKREMRRHRSELQSKAERLESIRRKLEAYGITLTIGAEEKRHGRNSTQPH